MIPSAYVHVPFCASICRYCAFERTARVSWIEPWLERICAEIRQTLQKARSENPDFFLETIYIGGGTPSLLSARQLDRLLGCFDGYFSSAGEWTLEANPESVDAGRLETARRHGVNRLSIGIQSFDDARLQALGRRHSAAQALRAVELAREAGFDNISADLMYGFSDQSELQLALDLQAFLGLDIDHLSIYSLIVEPDSIFGRQHLQEIDDEQGAALYEQIERTLQAAGYRHYEVSSYARNGKFGRHNLRIWQDGPYYGFGFGAVGRDETGLYRWDGTLKEYIDGCADRIYEENSSPWFDALMTGLRTDWGVDLKRWNQKYGRDFRRDFGRVLERYPRQLVIENGCLKTTGSGREILDSILVDFLMED